MKKSNYLIIVLLGCLFLCACNSEKRLQKAINKYGQKESAAYFVANYPEYFNAKVIHDTIHDTVEVSIPEVIHNAEFDSTAIADLLTKNKRLQWQNDSVKIELYKTSHGKIVAQITEKPQVIKQPVVLPRTFTCPPCPDIDKLKSVFEKARKKTWFDTFKDYSAYTLWFLILIGGLLLIQRIRNKVGF